MNLKSKKHFEPLKEKKQAIVLACSQGPPVTKSLLNAKMLD